MPLNRRWQCQKVAVGSGCGASGSVRLKRLSHSETLGFGWNAARSGAACWKQEFFSNYPICRVVCLGGMSRKVYFGGSARQILWGASIAIDLEFNLRSFIDVIRLQFSCSEQNNSHLVLSV